MNIRTWRFEENRDERKRECESGGVNQGQKSQVKMAGQVKFAERERESSRFVSRLSRT